MTKQSFRVISAIVIAGLTFSCSSPKKTDETKKSVDSIETESTDSSSSEIDTISKGKSLNDILFANFKDKDWLDNDYIRTLRKYIDSFT